MGSHLFQNIKNQVIMKKNTHFLRLLIAFLGFYTEGSFAQVAINTNGAPAGTNTMLDLNPAIGKAFVPPKMTYAQIKAISPASEGMLVYDTEFKTMRMYNGTRWMNLTQQVDLPGTFTTQGATTVGDFAATVDAAGNFYLAGDFTGTLAFGGLAGSLTATSASGGATYIPNAFVVKYNASGVAQWARQGGFQNNDTFGHGVAVDGSGNVFITGAFYGETRFNGFPLFAAGIIDAFVVKYNSSGAFQWANRGGGTSEDGGSAITTDASGNVYIAGYFSGNATFDISSLVLGGGTISVTGTAGGGNDAFVAKYSAGGLAVWVKSGGGSGDDKATKVTTDASNNVYIGGYFNTTAVFAATPSPISITSAGSADAFTAKYDVNGNVLWAKRAGGTGDDIGLIQAIAADASGNVYVTGAYSGTLTVAPLAAITSAGGLDIFLLKYNSTGVEQWIKSAGGAGSDYGSGIATDALGAVFVTGRFSGTGFFGTLPSINSAGSEDAFLIKYDSSGGDQWIQKAGGAGSDYGRVVFIAPSGAVFTLGKFVPTAQFATQSLTTGNTFVMKYME
jgi:Beta-propeller repeat